MCAYLSGQLVDQRVRGVTRRRGCIRPSISMMASPTRATRSSSSAWWYSATTDRATRRSDLLDTSTRLSEAQTPSPTGRVGRIAHERTSGLRAGAALQGIDDGGAHVDLVEPFDALHPAGVLVDLCSRQWHTLMCREYSTRYSAMATLPNAAPPDAGPAARGVQRPMSGRKW